MQPRSTVVVALALLLVLAALYGLFGFGGSPDVSLPDVPSGQAAEQDVDAQSGEPPKPNNP